MKTRNYGGATPVGFDAVRAKKSEISAKTLAFRYAIEYNRNVTRYVVCCQYMAVGRDVLQIIVYSQGRTAYYGYGKAACNPE